MGEANVLVREDAEPVLVKLDLGCGKAKREGFLGVDAIAFDGVDVVADLRSAWPWAENSVDEVHCSHFLEHLTGAERVHFFNELYRVLKAGGKATIICPHWSSERAYGDPTHQWPPVCGFAFYYLSKQWRAGNAPHTGYECNFQGEVKDGSGNVNNIETGATDFDATWGYSLAHPWQLKSQEVQMFAMNHYINVAQDIVATITKK